MKDAYIIIAVLFLLFSYVVFRVVVKRDYKKHMKLTPISYILEVLVFAFHANSIYLILPSQWPQLPSLPEDLILKTVSIVIFSIGVFILVISYVSLGNKPSLGMDKNKLKTDGFYKYSRNPQLLGYGIMLLAFTMLFFSWLLLFWFIQYLIISFVMIKSEEEFLVQRYGDAYSDYHKKVPRIIKLWQ